MEENAWKEVALEVQCFRSAFNFFLIRARQISRWEIILLQKLARSGGKASETSL